MEKVELHTKELLKLVSDDNQRAFDLFYNLYYKQIFRFAYYHTKSTEACREIVSNVFLSIWKSRQSLANIETLDAYLYVITKNESYRYLEKQAETHFLSIDDIPIQIEADSTSSPDEKIISEEIEKLIEKLINNLPEKCRVIFLLSRNDGLKTNEIAKTLSLSESTVRVQLKIAIGKIITQLKPIYPHLDLILFLLFLLQKNNI